VLADYDGGARSSGDRSLVRRSSVRLLTTILALCVLTGTTHASAAVIDRDTGFDANDVPPNGHIDPDIRSTTRRLAERDGSRVLAIVVRFYERNAWWPLWIRLDARGGPRVDHIVSTISDQCYIWQKGHREERIEGRAAGHGDRFVCRMPARVVSPTKSIRWKVRTQAPDGSRPGSEFVMDFAPSDRGWYA
jgi:hypothetical protein